MWHMNVTGGGRLYWFLCISIFRNTVTVQVYSKPKQVCSIWQVQSFHFSAQRINPDTQYELLVLGRAS